MIRNCCCKHICKRDNICYSKKWHSLSMNCRCLYTYNFRHTYRYTVHSNAIYMLRHSCNHSFVYIRSNMKRSIPSIRYL